MICCYHSENYLGSSYVSRLSKSRRFSSFIGHGPKIEEVPRLPLTNQLSGISIGLAISCRHTFP